MRRPALTAALVASLGNGELHRFVQEGHALSEYAQAHDDAGRLHRRTGRLRRPAVQILISKTNAWLRRDRVPREPDIRVPEVRRQITGGGQAHALRVELLVTRDR